MQNVSTAFYPNYNKNWEQYDNVANWQIQVTLTLTDTAGLESIASTLYPVRDYDAESNIDSGIALVRVSTGQPISQIPYNEVVKVVALHKNLTGNWAGDLWGAITVEPFEQAPRWLCSSVIDTDNNQNNPLSPVTGTKISIDTSTPDIAGLECYLDASKIALDDGVKITSKIKGSTIAVWANDYSVSLDGVSQYVESASTFYALNSGLTATFSIWIKATNQTSGRFIFMNQSNIGIQDSQFMLWLRPTGGTWSLDFSMDNSSYYCRSNSGVVTDGQWHHIAVVVDLGSVWKSKIYVDGIDETYGQNMGSAPLTIPLASGKLALGENLQGYLNTWEGNLDEFAIFNTAFDSTAVNIWNGGTPTDLSGDNPLIYWRCGDNDSGTGSTITDQGSVGNNGSLINSASFDTDVP